MADFSESTNVQIRNPYEPLEKTSFQKATEKAKVLVRLKLGRGQCKSPGNVLTTITDKPQQTSAPVPERTAT